jgi:uncharacterized protein (DUF58 family)
VIKIAAIERTVATADPTSSTADPGSLGPSVQVRADEIDVRWRPSRHARRLLTLAAAGLLLAVVFRRPELAGLAAPALLLLGAGRAAGGGLPGRLTVRVGLTASRIYEGEPAAVDVVVTDAEGAEGVARCDARWALEPGKGVEPGSATSVNGPAARFTYTVDRWGKRKLGTEFTGVREFVPGDRQRAINWPASTRLGRLQVNTFAAERSQDVVLLVDATSDVGQPGQSALDLALRGASGAARAYLAARDRVGVIAYQWGGVQWLAPSLGRRQFYRIVDALLQSDAGFARGASFSRLPRAALPPGALVVVFSPLLDGRFVEALRDLRQRGFSLIVVDVLNAQPPRRRAFADNAARRIWTLEQGAIRFSLRELGVPVVAWDGITPLDLPLAPYTRRPLVTRR